MSVRICGWAYKVILHPVDATNDLPFFFLGNQVIFRQEIRNCAVGGNPELRFVTIISGVNHPFLPASVWHSRLQKRLAGLPYATNS